ncbi:MAG: 2Fe-2S iron-sulfur cluster-binding protein [Candidatus Thorarchaeota archaeon]
MGDLVKEFTVETGTKLLKALIDNEIDIVHSCGGKAKCTTCRFTARKGIPRKVTQAQKETFDRKIEGGQPQFDAPQVFLSVQRNNP